MSTTVDPLPPGPRWPHAAIRFAMKQDPLRLFEYGQRHHGDTVLYDSGSARYVVLANAPGVEHILLRNHRAYWKSAEHPVISRILGEGVIMTNGERWRQQRRALAPAFQPRQLEALVQGMERTTTAFVDTWLRCGRTDIDVYDELSILTRRVVGGALFGTYGDETGGELGRALDEMVVRANLRADRPWSLSLRYPTPRNRRFHRCIEHIDAFVYRLIRERRAGRGGSDVLAMLMRAHEESGVPPMDDEELRDQILNLFFAGFETSASAMTWTFLLLSKHPEAARRIAEEAATVLAGKPMRYEHLAKLEYLGWVLNEAMRLYPPIWTNERVAQEDDVIDGYRIPKGTMVAVSTWLLHRNPRLWDAPERFDPLRFSPARSVGRHKHAFVPFGLGPRTCVGHHFATMQSKVMVATIVQRMAIEVAVTDPKPVTAVTLRPAGKVPGRLRVR